MQQIIDRGYILLRGFWVHMIVADRRGPAIFVQGQWLRMPIVECWDLWYQQISLAAQLVYRMSRGAQRGLPELSNAGQDSPAAERKRSTHLESGPAVTTAPRPSPGAESLEDCRGCLNADLEHFEQQRAVRSPPSVHAFQRQPEHKTQAPPAAKWFQTPCFSPPGRRSSHRKRRVESLKHRPPRPKAPATRSRKRKPKLAVVPPRRSRKLPRTAMRPRSQTPFSKSTPGSQLQSNPKEEAE